MVHYPHQHSGEILGALESWFAEAGWRLRAVDRSPRLKVLRNRHFGTIERRCEVTYRVSTTRMTDSHAW